VEVESQLQDVGRDLAARLPKSRNPVRALDDKAMELSAQDAELRAALFRFVDVTPACRSLDDLARHLSSYLEGVEEKPPPLKAAMRMAESRAGRTALGAAAAAGVRHMAHRFIVGATPRDAAGDLRSMWKDGIASSLDLLGEATVTQDEADRYAERCADALRELAKTVEGLPGRDLLERDSLGPLPRANLSVKVSALTPMMRPEAPELGREDAARRLRPLLRLAREVGAHLHVDMESVDSLETTLELVFELLSEDEFAGGPSAGVVLQAYLCDSPAHLDRLLEWARASTRPPLVVRLVKGAYWDHEVVEARQHGWSPPVYTDKHAIAYNRATGGEDRDLELQVLRGLGDDLAHALAESGFRVRSYCPVGELVAGMAYLVRRLLENTSNESFLNEQSRGVPIEELLAAP
jgi:proline dehydrogenase